MAAKKAPKANIALTSDRPLLRPLASVAAVVLVIATLGIAWQQLTRSDVLPITELRLSGDFQQQPVEGLKEVVAGQLTGNFFTVDVASIHASVVALPWIDFAWVDRIWPNVLQVRVVEEKPIAYLVGIGLMNSRGKIFSTQVDETAFNNLPRLKGPFALREKLAIEYQRFATQLQRFDTQISELVLDERGSWRMTLSNGVEMMMGQQDAVLRLEKFLRIFGDRFAEDSDIRRIDLRYSNGFSVSSRVVGGSSSKQYNWVS